LVNEIIACLKPRPGDVIADCTLGYGGHASEFLKLIGPAGRLLGFDMDGSELARTKDRLSALAQKLYGSKVTQPGEPAALPKLSFYNMNFAGIGNVLNKEQLEGYDIIFADLGVSSMHASKLSSLQALLPPP
jgi:16S rRNA (cytosine1402-N4)-methyltransferase